MLGNVSLFTYGIAALGFFVLAVLLLTQWRGKPLGLGLLAASGATGIWAATVAIGTLYEYPPITLINLTELARNSIWVAFLLQLLGFQEDGDGWRVRGYPWPPFLAGAALLCVGIIALRPLDLISRATDLALAMWLGQAVVGLLLVEQVYRNSRSAERWGIKFLCLALGSLFAYDLFMYAEAMLFRELDAQIWQARGLVTALILPWLVIAIARNQTWKLHMYVSRHVVFHTVTLVGAGAYLIGMSVIGYFIKYAGGNWGGVLQVGFLVGSGALLFTLLFSSNLRARLRVFLSKHFFSYRYDYRQEWLKFTAGLTNLGDNVPDGILRTMAAIVPSTGGILLFRGASGALDSSAHWNCAARSDGSLGDIAEWIVRTGWIIDIPEWRRSPDLYGELALPEWMAKDPDLRLAIPLMFQNELEGLLCLRRTDLKDSINWEDRDLLKTAGRQAAALLAQQRASAALVEARQFDAFNRLSAYVIHDLKNILAQQSLMVANAQKHRDNPAFIDDMISTVENSVNRMQRLMDQMRSGLRQSEVVSLKLQEVLETAIAQRSGSRPQPQLSGDANLRVTADRERLVTVFSHLFQNAQEATDDDGRITITVEAGAGTARVSICDTGCGMSEAFVREQLFKPFESTKGLTGMGIGAFESREYVRAVGGNIDVESTPDVGTTFTVSLPLSQAAITEPHDLSAQETATQAPGERPSEDAPQSLAGVAN